ncbi:MAG TPA: hypothetical protein VFV65_03635 [Gemmatimonadales bacterium]|nr:hypothetical protein [Gemmatimonadales bacterium]
MISLTALWLPILLSAVAVFVASSIIHMMLTFWHKGEYPPVPNEDAVMDALRPFAIPPGDYMVPRCDDPKEMQTPAFKDKLDRGPVLIMTVLPNGAWAMGPALVKWFLYAAGIALVAAYVTSRALPAGAAYLEVFRFAGVTAFACYAVGLWQMHIWYHRALRATITSTIDGLLYACLTAGVFGWLWPR